MLLVAFIAFKYKYSYGINQKKAQPLSELRFYGEFSIGSAALVAFPAAATGAATELLSPSEWDTVTVPVVILIALMLTTI